MPKAAPDTSSHFSLATRAVQSLPPGTRGALVHRAPLAPGHPITASWLPPDAQPLRLGQILLHWERAEAGWNVTARLGLAATEVHLASWEGTNDDWPDLVRPTLHEVRGLCSALAVASSALVRSLHLDTP